jgi:hypothetical protein
MALSKDSDMETMSLILLKEQTGTIRAIAKARTTRHQKVSISDVGREIVALGLETYLSRPYIGIGTNASVEEVEAVPA